MSHDLCFIAQVVVQQPVMMQQQQPLQQSAHNQAQAQQLAQTRMELEKLKVQTQIQNNEVCRHQTHQKQIIYRISF